MLTRACHWPLSVAEHHIMPAAPPPLSWKARLCNFYTSNKRDIFFGFVAFFALATVARAEMMRKGVLQPPPPQEVHPKVSREFGKSKRKSEE
ncbi:unspecified product [Leishmania tarentolae]|uniref:Unspecified product n=1 Tax=Leishmania tarentolae TaxID=5689 RepID=A0A640KI02_LEITA|nr:unspecified product [Leishmania tarentolae]